jgi:hypothetical protein
MEGVGEDEGVPPMYVPLGVLEGVAPGERVAEGVEEGMTITAARGKMPVSMLSALS